MGSAYIEVSCFLKSKSFFSKLKSFKPGIYESYLVTQPYLVKFNPSYGGFGVEESSACFRNFEECTRFLGKQYFQLIKEKRPRPRFQLEKSSNISASQGKILENIVNSFNRSATFV